MDVLAGVHALDGLIVDIEGGVAQPPAFPAAPRPAPAGIVLAPPQPPAAPLEFSRGPCGIEIRLVGLVIRKQKGPGGLQQQVGALLPKCTQAIENEDQCQGPDERLGIGRH